MENINQHWKKKKEMEDGMKEIAELKNKTEIGIYLNKEKKREKVTSKINMERWKENLLNAYEVIEIKNR